MRNVEQHTVDGFGAEWERFDHASPDHNDLQAIFEQYFSEFPWDSLPPNPAGADFGCGTGRWARYVAPRTATLHCIDASSRALDVAKRNLHSYPQCVFSCASVSEVSIEEHSLDFAYSLGVLHHVPDTESALAHCVSRLKKGAPFLLYLYYALDNRPLPFRLAWRASDILRRVIAELPPSHRVRAADALAASVYLPLARGSLMLERAFGVDVSSIPLSFYRNKTFYIMRNDALDRFGTRLEKRFTRGEIQRMMERAGLRDIRFREGEPYWCAIGYA